jgi:hypothetical protein
MSEKPKRKFWQIHLSTAIVTMLAAAAFGYFQTRGVEDRFPVSLGHPTRPPGMVVLGDDMANLVLDTGISYGWPWHFVHVGHVKTQVIPLPTAIVFVLFIAIIATTAIVSESLIRRREACKA